jgi:hypothetical protein
MSQNFSNELRCVIILSEGKKVGINGLGLTLGRIQAPNDAESRDPGITRGSGMYRPETAAMVISSLKFRGKLEICKRRIFESNIRPLLAP